MNRRQQQGMMAICVMMLMMSSSVIECRPQFFNGNNFNPFNGLAGNNNWGSSFQSIGLGQGTGSMASNSQGMAGGASLGPFGGFALGTGAAFGLG